MDQKQKVEVSIEAGQGVAIIQSLQDIARQLEQIRLMMKDRINDDSKTA